jgi:lipooligosaccharide transport system permease protein
VTSDDRWPPGNIVRQPISLTAAARVWQRNLWVYRSRWLYALLPNFFEPLFYLLGMGLGLGFYVSTGEEFGAGYLAFIAPGLVAASAMNGASFETTYNVFIKLHFARLYDAFIATRANMEDVALGELLWAVTRALMYGSIFLFITLFFDTPLTWRVVLALPAIALVGFCFAAIGLSFTSVIPIIDVYSYYFTLFLTPSFLFSDIFFPVADRFPPAVVAVAELTPLYRSVQLLRGILMGDFTGRLADVAYLLVLGTALSAFSIWQMRRKVVR